MKNHIREQIQKWGIHIVFCILFLYYFRNHCDLRPAAYPYYYKEFITGLIALAVIYLNYILLFPKLYICRRYEVFWILTVCSIVISGCLEMLLVYPEVKRMYLQTIEISKITIYIIYDTATVTLRNGGWVLFAFAAREIQRLRKEAAEKENIIQKRYKFVDVRDSDYKIGVINSEDIYYCIQEKNIVTIHSVDSGIYYRYCSMKNMENLLGTKEFVRISRNAIVSKRFISIYNDNQLELRKLNKYTNNIIFSIGESYVEYVKDQLKPNIAEKAPDNEDVKEKSKRRKTKKKTTFIPKNKTVSECFEQNPKLMAVYQYIESHPDCKVNVICNTCRLPQGTVRRYIGFLMDKRLIQHTGSRRYGGYSIVSQD